MIAEIGKSNSVKAVVEYNEKKVSEGKAHVIYDNTMAADGKGRIEAMHDSLSLNGRVKIEAFHTPLSFNPDDTALTDRKMVEIARDYAEKMGYGNTPMVIYRHLDTNHQHLHITCPTVDFDGFKINDSKDFKRSMEVSRQLEKKYDLLATDYLFREHDKFNEIQREMHVVLNAVKVELFEDYDFQHFNREDYKAFLRLVDLAHRISKERADEEDLENKSKGKEIKAEGVTTAEYLKVKKSFSEVGFYKILNLLEARGHKVKTKKQLLIEELDKCRNASVDLKTYEQELTNRGIVFRRVGSGAADYIYCNSEGTLWVKQKQLPPRFSVKAIRNRDLNPLISKRKNKSYNALVTNLRQVFNISLSHTDFKVKLSQLNMGIEEIKVHGMKEYHYTLNGKGKTVGINGNQVKGFSYAEIQNHFNNPNKLLLRERIALNELPINDRYYIGSIGSGNYLKPNKLEIVDAKKQKTYVFNSINKSLDQANTYDEFKDTLIHKYRIELIENSNTGGVSGISFKNWGVQNPETFKGSQLGKNIRYDLLVNYFTLKKDLKPIRIYSHFSDCVVPNHNSAARFPLAPFKTNITGTLVKLALKTIMSNNNNYQNEQELKKLKRKYENQENDKGMSM